LEVEAGLAVHRLAIHSRLMIRAPGTTYKAANCSAECSFSPVDQGTELQTLSHRLRINMALDRKGMLVP
jgi:hypothetical protein